MRIRTLGIAVIYVSLITVLGCASVGIRDTRSEENLRQRVLAFYSYWEAGDYFRAFEFENMSLDGEVSAKEYATGRRGSGMRNVKITGVTIENDTAFVSIESKLQTPQLSGFQRFSPEMDYKFRDKWVFRNNNWYHIKKGQTKEW